MTKPYADLEAENARLRDELKMWKPMTPEEADAALAEIEGIPISDEEIERMIEYATDPANIPLQMHYTKLTAKVKQLQAERDRYRALCAEFNVAAETGETIEANKG